MITLFHQRTKTAKEHQGPKLIELPLQKNTFHSWSMYFYLLLHPNLNCDQN